MTSKNVWIGIDVGSITCKFVIVDRDRGILAATYERTHGRVIDAVKAGLEQVRPVLHGATVRGCATTGSARSLVAILVGADLAKNEITTHAHAALTLHPQARTLLEIGGEDSKIILLKDRVPIDFAMNTVCAAGTGAFLDQLASRLGIPVSDLGELAVASTHEVAIAGRCTVFAESDIIFKQQAGHRTEDIVAGACQALVRNYLNDVGIGKEIVGPVLFFGGVAANEGIRRAFEKALDLPVEVPKGHRTMGALGAALLSMREGRPLSAMRPVEEILASDFATQSFLCESCPNHCEIVRFVESGVPVGFSGGRCDRWNRTGLSARSAALV